MHRRNGEVMLEDLVRRREGARDITVPRPELRDHVRNRRIHFQVAVASGRHAWLELNCFRMDDRRGWLHRVLGAEDRRQLRILDIDQLERGLRDLDGIGRDRGNFLTDEARYALGEQWNILAHTAIACIGHIGAGQHCMNAGQRFGSLHIDRDDACAGVRAAQAAAEEHARQLDIAGIASAACYLANAVHALHRLANGLAAQPCCLHAILIRRYWAAAAIVCAPATGLYARRNVRI